MLYLNPEYFFSLIYRLISRLRFDAFPPWLGVVWIFIFFFFWFVIVILTYRIIRHRQTESRDMAEMLRSPLAAEPLRNDRWQKVLKYLESENPAEWKLAIIEADTMLDDLVKDIQPHGENLGERLKAIEPSDFDTLQDAWEAHKMRNRIAHEHDFALSKNETLRTIAMFRRVFEEFNYI